MTTSTLAPYRQSLFVLDGGLFSRCLTVSSAIGTALVIAVLLVPIRARELAHVTTVPARMARLILEPAKPRVLDTRELPRPASDAMPLGDGGPLGDSGPDGDVGRVGAPSDPAPGPAGPGPLRPSRGDLTSPIGPNAGSAGRALANATVRAELAGTSQALSSALDGLSSSLASTAATAGTAPATGARAGRDRSMRAARAAARIGTPGDAALAGGAGAADLGGSAMAGSRVSIGALSGGGGSFGGSGMRSGDGSGSGGGGGGGGVDGGGGGGTGTGGGGGTGSGGPGGSGRGGGGGGGGAGGGGGDGIGGGGGVGAPGVYRSNASLLAVIQKYAPGIHYCYTNELKHDPTLSGKLVFALIVSAGGEVTEVTVVENGLRAPRLTSCALAQIREWRFPPVPRGSTSFQVPFVFTPPR